MTDEQNTNSNAACDQSGPQDNPVVVDAKRAETLLAHGTIADIQGIMPWGSNYAELVLISDDELQATAIYKPQRGERPLWDFPDGTLCYREVASYIVSQALGWLLVPPTVLREGPHGVGSFQLFISHNPDINYFSLDDRFTDPLQQYAVFDYVINNADRKGGHLLLDAYNKLWGIDHGLTFNAVLKLRTVIWDFANQPIPGELLHAVEQLLVPLLSPDSSLNQQLSRLLSAAEISALLRRIRHLLECKIFPKPDSGPSFPWPPV